MYNKFIGKKTYIFDIDGTLLQHAGGNEGYSFDSEPTLGAVEKVQELHKDGHYIILISARPEYHWQQTAEQLAKHKIPWNSLVLGVGSGTRYLINDEKPTNKKTAIGIVVERDKGLEGLDL